MSHILLFSLNRRPNLRCHIEGQWQRSTFGNTLLEQTLPPALGKHPIRGGGGGHQDDAGDHAACECDHLEWPSDHYGLEDDLRGTHPAVCTPLDTGGGGWMMLVLVLLLYHGAGHYSVGASCWPR